MRKQKWTRASKAADVAAALSTQATAIREKMESLTESLHAIETLKTEVLQMQSVDFKKYADIIVNLRMKNEFYWLIKHFDSDTLDHIRSRFDHDSGLKMINTFNNLLDKAIRLARDGVPPASSSGQSLARDFWNMVMEFTGGDMKMLPRLMEIGNFDGMDNEWKQKQMTANAYIEPALEVYFTNLGVDPFEGENK